MQKDNTAAMAAGLAIGAAGLAGLWAARRRGSSRMKKMARRAAHAAENAVLGLDKLARDYL